jgi:multiple sugar transport system substrate-binding protein
MVLKDQPGQDVPTIELINEWAKKNNVDVNITTNTFSVLDTQVATTLQSGSGPDLVILQNFGTYLYDNALLDVSDVAARLASENGGFYPIAERLSKVGNTWKSIPTYLYMHLLAYRDDVFRKAGILKAPATWTEFRTALDKIKKSNSTVAPFGVAYGRSFDGQQFLLSLIWSNGGDVVTADGKVVLNSPATVRGIQYAIDLYNAGLVAPGLLSWNDSTNNQAILAGQVATTFNGYSAKAQAVNQPELYKAIKVTVYPAGPEGRFSFPTAFSYGIRKNTAQPALAKDLLYFLNSKASYTKVVNRTLGAIGTVYRGLATLTVFKDPTTDATAHVRAIESARILPPSRAAAEVTQQQIIIDILADVINNKMTVEAAVAKAHKRIEDIYAQYK